MYIVNKKWFMDFICQNVIGTRRLNGDSYKHKKYYYIPWVGKSAFCNKQSTSFRFCVDEKKLWAFWGKLFLIRHAKKIRPYVQNTKHKCINIML